LSARADKGKLSTAGTIRLSTQNLHGQVIAGEFRRADEGVLKQRRIFKARRGAAPAVPPTASAAADAQPGAAVSADAGAAAATASNPFAGISLTAPAAGGNPFAGVSLIPPAATPEVCSSRQHHMHAMSAVCSVPGYSFCVSFSTRGQYHQQSCEGQAYAMQAAKEDPAKEGAGANSKAAEAAPAAAAESAEAAAQPNSVAEAKEENEKTAEKKADGTAATTSGQAEDEEAAAAPAKKEGEENLDQLAQELHLLLEELASRWHWRTLLQGETFDAVRHSMHVRTITRGPSIIVGASVSQRHSLFVFYNPPIH
jgi:hypothetical protein